MVVALLSDDVPLPLLLPELALPLELALPELALPLALPELALPLMLALPLLLASSPDPPKLELSSASLRVTWERVLGMM